ncbi:MAG: 16S rRNA (cytidine(1402)-2'-O)-methyltransferase [Deferribacterales bacterium]
MNKTVNKPKLYIVPTPIGNLGDITYRAVEVLKTVDIIFSEDTRNTLKLLNHLGIKKKLLSYYKDNELKATKQIFKHINDGEIVALTSDAGTPCISDPGQIIIKKLIENNIPFEVLPGPTAFIPAVIKSGFPTDKIYFSGFLPQKNSDRKEYLNYLQNNISATIVFYESPHRIISTLKELLDIFSPPISVSRELTKIHETTYFIFSEEDIEEIKPRGEFVIVINNKITTNDSLYNIQELLIKLQKENFNNQEIIKIFKVLGIRRNVIYRLLLKND